MADARDLHDLVPRVHCVVRTCEHHRSGAVGHQRAVVQPERIRDHRIAALAFVRKSKNRFRVQQPHPLRNAAGAEVGQRVFRPVPVTERRHRREHPPQLLVRQAESLLVALGIGGKEHRERHALRAFRGPVRRASQRVCHVLGGQQIHLLHAEDQHVPIPPRLNRVERIVEGRRRRRAGAFRARHGLEAQAWVDLASQRRDVFLVDEQRRRARPDPDGVDFVRRDLGVFDGAATCFDDQIVEGMQIRDLLGFAVAFDERAELGVVSANDADLAHVLLRAGWSSRIQVMLSER